MDTADYVINEQIRVWIIYMHTLAAALVLKEPSGYAVGGCSKHPNAHLSPGEMYGT